MTVEFEFGSLTRGERDSVAGRLWLGMEDGEPRKWGEEGSVQSKFHRMGVDLVAAQIRILNGIFPDSKYRIVLIIRNASVHAEYLLLLNTSEPLIKFYKFYI